MVTEFKEERTELVGIGVWSVLCRRKRTARRDADQLQHPTATEEGGEGDAAGDQQAISRKRGGAIRTASSPR
jgi:hypothetical protein